jgi:hypothetical protein
MRPIALFLARQPHVQGPARVETDPEHDWASHPPQARPERAQGASAGEPALDRPRPARAPAPARPRRV